MSSPRRDDDRGVSLIELIIVMALLSLVMTLVATVFISSLREGQTVSAKTTSTADARIAMEALSRDLRVAISPDGTSPAISTAEPRRVTYYAALGASSATTDPLPSLVDFGIDTTARCLRRSITPAVLVGSTLTWPAAGTVSTCVARGDINATGGPLFTYLPLATVLVPDPPPFDSTPPGGVVSSDLSKIASVQITLAVTDAQLAAVAPTLVQGQVSLINVVNKLKGGAS